MNVSSSSFLLLLLQVILVAITTSSTAPVPPAHPQVYSTRIVTDKKEWLFSKYVDFEKSLFKQAVPYGPDASESIYSYLKTNETYVVQHQYKPEDWQCEISSVVATPDYFDILGSIYDHEYQGTAAANSTGELCNVWNGKILLPFPPQGYFPVIFYTTLKEGYPVQLFLQLAEHVQDLYYFEQFNTTVPEQEFNLPVPKKSCKLH